MATSCPLPGMLTTLPFANTQLARFQLPNGNEALAVVPCSSMGCSHLFIISLPDGTVEKIPLQDNGASVVTGPDGCLYLGTFTGRLLRFDPATKEVREFFHAFEGEKFCVGFRSASGKIFFGSTPGAIVVEYDPAQQGGAHYFHWRSDKMHPQRVCAFADQPDGRVAAFLNGVNHSVLLINPNGDDWERQELTDLHGERGIQCVVPYDAESVIISTHPGRRLFRVQLSTLSVLNPLPPLPDEDALYCLERLGDDFVASGISGAMYRCTQGTWERLAVPMPNDPLLFTALPDSRLAGVTFHGRLLQSTPDQRMYMVSPLPMREPDGLAIVAMGMAPDRKLYFAFANNMRLGCWDPDEEDAIAESFVASPFPGEVTALGFAGERLLMGFSESCGVMGYYPELAYRLMENPRFIGLAGDVQRQPIGPMVHHESNVYFAASAISENDEGAVVRVKPMDNEVVAFPGVIPEQDVTSMVADRLSGLLVVAGRLQGRSNRKAAASLAFWSPYQEQTVRRVTPFADAETLHVWAAEGGRIYVTDGGARYAILSSAGETMESGDFPLGVITSLITNQDGKLYGLAGGWMFHLDAEKACVERIVEATGDQLTEVRRGLFAFANGARITTVQLW